MASARRATRRRRAAVRLACRRVRRSASRRTVDTTVLHTGRYRDLHRCHREYRFCRCAEHAGQRSDSRGYHRVCVDVCFRRRCGLSERKRQRSDQRNDCDVPLGSKRDLHGHGDGQREPTGTGHEHGHGESSERRLHAGQHAGTVQRIGQRAAGSAGQRHEDREHDGADTGRQRDLHDRDREHRFGRRAEYTGQRSGACGYHGIRVDVCVCRWCGLSERERQRRDQRNDCHLGRRAVRSTYTVNATISASPPAQITNTATANPPNGVCTPGNTPAPCSGSASVPPGPQVSVTKTTNTTVLTPGGSVTYTIVVSEHRFRRRAEHAGQRSDSDRYSRAFAWTCATSRRRTSVRTRAVAARSTKRSRRSPQDRRLTYTVTATVAASPPSQIYEHRHRNCPISGVCTAGQYAGTVHAVRPACRRARRSA